MYVMIVEIKPSPLKNKRFRAIMQSGKKIDFGLKNGMTFLDHNNSVLKNAYHKRHLGNPIEKRLIENLVPSPALLSYVLLWGPNTTLQANIQYLNKLWKQKELK